MSIGKTRAAIDTRPAHHFFKKRGSPHCLDGRQSRRVQPIQATHIIRYYNKRPIKHHADKNKRDVCLPTIDDKSLRIINKLREWKSRANGSTCSTGGRLRGVSHLYKQHSHSCLTIISFPPLLFPFVRDTRRKQKKKTWITPGGNESLFHDVPSNSCNVYFNR